MGSSLDKGFMINESEVFREIKWHSEGSLGQATWKIPAHLPYFDGHFPGNPIFPAVGIVDATIYVLRGLLQQPHFYFAHFPVAKFLSPIQPEQSVRIELKPISEKEWQAEWKDEGSQKLLASLRFQL